MNLVTETETDLGSGEWHSTVVEIKESSKVDKDALGSLGAEETALGASGSNLGLEHKVEGKGLREVVSGFRGLDGELSDNLVKSILAISTNIKSDLVQAILLILLHVLLLGDELFNVLFNELVGSVALTRLGILDHEVSELLNVSLYN